MVKACHEERGTEKVTIVMRKKIVARIGREK